jgi:hypothetical protein
LNNGQVVVVGGFDGRKPLSSAELYNSDTGAFSPTGGMKEARANFTATLLNDGTVLVAGGATFVGWRHEGGRALASAQIYDPTTGEFSSVGPMSVARSFHTATLLASGKVLITGGFSDSGEPLDSADLYDPDTRCFTATAGKMTAARAGHTATLLDNNEVLLAGGIGNQLKPLVTAELYKPNVDKFVSTGSMNHPRAFHSAFEVGLYAFTVVLGGIDDHGVPQATAEYYNE